jgi:aminopeptidase-like protein
VGSLMRTKYQEYKEYHTSLDNRDFVSFPHMDRSVEIYTEIVRVLEMNDTYINKIRYCEPQLGKRGMYPSSVNPDDSREKLHNLMHFLTYADGETDLIALAEKRGRYALVFEDIIALCRENDLLE